MKWEPLAAPNPLTMRSQHGVVACGLRAVGIFFNSLWEIFPRFRQQGFLSAFFLAGCEGQTVEFADGVVGFASLLAVVVDVVGGV